MFRSVDPLRNGRYPPGPLCPNPGANREASESSARGNEPIEGTRSARARPAVAAHERESRAPRFALSTQLRHDAPSAPQRTAKSCNDRHLDPEAHVPPRAPHARRAVSDSRRPHARTPPTRDGREQGNGLGVPPRQPLIPTPRVGRARAILLPVRRIVAHGVAARLLSVARCSAHSVSAPESSVISDAELRHAAGCAPALASSFVSQEGL
jgi:hypothetical protein